MPDLTHLDPCGCRLDLITGKVCEYCAQHRPLEVDVDRLRQTVGELAIALEAVTRLCLLRHSGFCYLKCPGHVLCQHDNLTILPWCDLPEALKEVWR